MDTTESREHTILGQKYAYATVSLLLGILSFINLAGMEKAVLAIVFGWLSLRANPAPRLRERRSWARAGIVLGALVLVLVPLAVALNFNRLRELVEILSRLSSGR